MQPERPTGDSYTIVVVSDPHLSQGNGLVRWQRFVADLHARQADDPADCVLVLGDLLWPGELSALRALFEALPAPVHLVYGNNDLAGLCELEALFGARDRAFWHCGDLYLLLCDVPLGADADSHRGDISEAQWTWLERTLADGRARGARRILLATHIPPSCPQGFHPQFFMLPEIEARLWALCARWQIDALLCGHIHQYASLEHHGTQLIVAPSLNWNFVRAPDPPQRVSQGVEGGGYLRLRVGPEGVAHQYVLV